MPVEGVGMSSFARIKKSSRNTVAIDYTIPLWPQKKAEPHWCEILPSTMLAPRV